MPFKLPEDLKLGLRNEFHSGAWAVVAAGGSRQTALSQQILMLGTRQINLHTQEKQSFVLNSQSVGHLC